MNICIARNAEARSNAAIARVSKALYESNKNVFLLSRNRYSDEKTSVIKNTYYIDENAIDNYEIKLKSLPGKGISNIFQLFYFMAITFHWFLKNKEKYDIIHSFDLDVGLPTYLIAKLFKKKYIYHIADFYSDSRLNIPNFLIPLIKKLEFVVINNAETTIICSEEREQQIKGSKPKKLVVVHNTPMISDDQFKSIDSDKDDLRKTKEIVFTYVGGLDKSRFIDSALNIIKDYPQIKLRIAGMGKLTAFVEKASLENENIEFFGVVDYQEALNMYSNTDLLFAIYDPNVANHKYSAPNKVYEAMFLGKALIVAHGSGMDKIVEKHNMGFVIDYSELSFRTLIEELINSDESWKTFGDNAKEAYKLYSWSKMKNKIQQVYDEII